MLAPMAAEDPVPDVPGAVAEHAPGTLPAGTVSPAVSLRRSRIGWWVPVFGMPVLLALSALLAVTRVTPPGIGVIAFFWALAQGVWVGGATVTSRRQLPSVDRDRMLVTGRSWTGRRTLNLAELRQVRRMKWTFRSNQADYVTLADRAGVHLSMPRWSAAGPVKSALAWQRERGLPEARVSRFAAIGLGLAPSSIGFRTARTLVIAAGLAAYVAVVEILIVQVIPALAGYHGG